MKFIYVITFFIVTQLDAFLYAQNYSFLKKIETNNIPEKFSLDRYGNVLSADNNGVIYKYDKEINYLQNYSPGVPSAITLLEAWTSVSVFSFNNEFQSYTLLDRRLGLSGNYNLGLGFGFISLATPSSDGNIWLFDQDGFSIKKVSHIENEILIDIPLELIIETENFDISFLKEYQNNLYLIDNLSGVLVFDQLGNFKKKIEIKNIEWFGTLDDELYYLSEKKKLVFINLYTDNQRVINIPEHQSVTGVLMTKNKLILFSDSMIYLYATN